MKSAVLITTFVIAILSVIMVGIIATQTNTATSSVADSETVSITSARLAANNVNTTIKFPLITYSALNIDAGDCYGIRQGSLRITNGTTTIDITGNYTLTCASTGPYVTFANNSYTVDTMGNSTGWTWEYYPYSYLDKSFSRSVTNMIPGFLALMLLVGVVAGVYIFLRQTNKE